jgi:hypothetical protein
VGDKDINFPETCFIQQQFNAFAGGHFAARMLSGNPLSTATLARRGFACI